MTRLSAYFLPTEREPPADAEAISHKLMVRAGLIRQVGSGLWSWLPAGWRVHQRIVQIIREEMNAIGGQEMLMPVLHPAEPWRKTGRYDIDELFKLQDRRGADMVLAMTHEEIVTGHVAAAVRSYRDLPKILYHFQVKERDEPRPRAGVLRTREFIMKDSYTFDRDAEGLDARYALHAGAYERILDRIGLEWYGVKSDVGMMGGYGADEYMAPCAAGENDVALAPGYAANVEVAVGRRSAGRPARPARRARARPHPGRDDDRRARRPARRLRRRHAQGVSGRVGDDRDAAGGRPRRPSRQRDQASERARPAVSPGARGRDRASASARPATSAPSAPRCPSCSTRRSTPPRAGSTSSAPTSPTPTCGASSRGATFRSSRSTCAPWSPATPSTARRSASSPRSRSATSSSSGRGTPSPSAPPTWTSRARRSSCGWAATASARRGPPRRRSSSSPTSRASPGRASIAPFDVELVVLGKPGSDEREFADRIYGELQATGLEVLYDDRDAGPGDKFADAELLGCPLRLTVGRRTLAAGEIEVQVRRGRESRTVPVEGAARAVAELWRTLP